MRKTRSVDVAPRTARLAADLRAQGVNISMLVRSWIAALTLPEAEPESQAARATINLSLDEATMEKLDECRRHGISLAEIVRNAVEAAAAAK